MTINVKICTGTACYVMGGANLLNLQEHLTESEQKIVKIEGASCLGLCKEANAQTPYVKVNEQVISKATIESVLEQIRKLTKK